MRAIDLFCGCGGLSLGFQNAGIEIVSAYDNWEVAIKVYNENFEHQAKLMDISELEIGEIKKYNPDLIIGGPPCQDYSSAGKRDETLGRAELTLVYANKVCQYKPKWFVMENVERILKSSNLNIVKKEFKDYGYGLTDIILDASFCGVPQKRKRYFLIGGLDEEDNFLKSILEENQSYKRMTVREYMGDELDVEHYYRHPRSYKRRGVFSIDEPSPTVRGVNRPIPPGYIFHKGDTCNDLKKIRPLTFEERARVQTFPSNFKFSGSKTDMEQMIGNAVPVNLANYMATSLLSYINNSSNKYKFHQQISML